MEVFIREQASSTSHLDICVEYNVQYIILFSTVQYIYYMVKYTKQHNAQYNIKEAGRWVFLRELASSASHLDACVQCSVRYSVNYSV